MGIIAFIALIIIVVFPHELGHLWAFRKCGVDVETFSVGVWKPLFSKTDSKGTVWQFAILPLGGYVKPNQEQAENMTPLQKFFVAAAGPAVSLIPLYFIEGLAIMKGLPSPTAKVFALIFETGISADSLGGPASVFKFAADAAASGILSFFVATALFSVMLGFLNLLPIPPLDGGHMLLSIFEGILGKESTAYKVVSGLLTTAGILLVLLLMGTSIFNDIQNFLF